MRMRLRNKKVPLLILVGIFSITYILLILFELDKETAISRSLVNQERQVQEDSVRDTATSMASELNSVLGRMEDLAVVKSGMYDTINRTDSEYLYDELFNRTYFDSKNTIDRLFEVNRSGILTKSLFPPGEESFYGVNVSFRDYFKDSMRNQAPSFSSMIRGLDGINRIVITYPILFSNGTDGTSESNTPAAAKNSSNQERHYLGLVGASMPVKSFERYGNTNSIESQYMVMLDNNGTFMLTPRTEFIGKSIFGADFQKIIDRDNVYNELVRMVTVDGKPASGTYDIDEFGRYLNTGFPVFLMNGSKGTNTTGNNGDNIDAQRPQYSLFVITPFSAILSNLNELLFAGRIQTLAILTILTVAVSAVFILFYRWNKDLASEVQEKTIHLTNANDRLQEANRKLVADEKAKQEFISMVSHELRTPLTPIKAFAEMLLRPKYMDQAVLNEKQTKAVNSIVQNIKVLEKLVADVLDIYRIEMGRLKLSIRTEDVEELMNQSLSNYKSMADEKNIVINSEILTRRGTKIYCDPERICQVFGNLIKNSIDFVSQGGRITLRSEELTGPRTKEEIFQEKNEMAGGNADEETKSRLVVQKTPSTENNREESSLSRKEPRYILFTVEDNGIGIPQEKIDHLFQKFYQVDTNLTRKHGGTGLGLAICKGIIEAHGGKIWIDKGYREGAAIKFTLRKAEDNDTSKQISSDAAGDRSFSNFGSSDPSGRKEG